MSTLLILLALCTAVSAPDTSLYEVDVASWSGDRIRQLSLRFIDQASDLLECAAAAAKQLLSDQLLVFIGGDGAVKSQCILANRSATLCRRLPPAQFQSPCCIRVFVKSLDSCWTTIQRRVDNSTDFQRNWAEYADGFDQGPHGNYWIGLRTLHSLTWPTARSLRVRMKLWNNTEFWADYSSFSVASEADKFRLSVSGFSAGQENIGDSMAAHNGKKFSTIDSDNDANVIGNCAVSYRGGWWYGACHSSNPNGLYYNLPEALTTPSYADGIVWYHNFGFYYSMKEFEMLIC